MYMRLPSSSCPNPWRFVRCRFEQFKLTLTVMRSDLMRIFFHYFFATSTMISAVYWIESIPCVYLIDNRVRTALVIELGVLTGKKWTKWNLLTATCAVLCGKTYLFFAVNKWKNKYNPDDTTKCSCLAAKFIPASTSTGVRVVPGDTNRINLRFLFTTCWTWRA